MLIFPSYYVNHIATAEAACSFPFHDIDIVTNTNIVNAYSIFASMTV